MRVCAYFVIGFHVMQEGGHLSAHFLPDLSLSQSTALLSRHQLQKPKISFEQYLASSCRKAGVKKLNSLDCLNDLGFAYEVLAKRDDFSGAGKA